MTKILVRGCSDPFLNPDMFRYVTENLGATNSGNMLYLASMVKMLMKKDTQVDTIRFFPEITEVTDELVDRINSEYDYFVLPLANAFRVSYLPEMALLTSLVRRLEIPCVIPCVGMQGGLDGRCDIADQSDQAKAFIDAVLDKSARIGIRGERTGKYLEELGYRDGIDFQVVGCPSMYYYGADLPVPEKKELTSRSRITYNRKLFVNAKTQHFMDRTLEHFSDSYFVPQNLYDYSLQYRGTPIKRTNRDHDTGGYPVSPYDRLLKEDRIKCFLNVPTWIRFLSKSTFHFGTRIHGNIAGVLAGVPTFIFPPDSRVCELAEFHSIPHMNVDEIGDDTDIFRIYEKTDFTSALKGHKERFDDFVKFLADNQLPNIYDQTEEYPEGLPYDLKCEKIRFREPLKSWSAVTPLTRRYRSYKVEKWKKEHKQ